MLIVAIILAGVVVLATVMKKQRSLANKINAIPGLCKSSMGDGFFGLLAMTRISYSASTAGPHETLFRLAEGLAHLFPDGIASLWIGPVPYLIVMSAELAEPFLSNPEINIRTDVIRFLEPFMGKGLITSQGEKWKYHRKILTPAFHFKILKNSSEIMSQNGRILVHKLGQKMMSHGGVIDDLNHHISLCALDVICESAMGEKCEAQTNPHREIKYLAAIEHIGEVVGHRLARPWLYPDFIFNLTKSGRKHNDQVNISKKFTDSVIASRKQEIAKQSHNHQERKPFLDLMIEEALSNPGCFTDADIRDEANTFMAAGHETTGSSVTWAMFLLGLHPEDQQQVHDEIDDLLSDGDPDRDLTFDEIRNRLRFLEAVVMETLRLFPIVPTSMRSIEKEIIAGRHLIPAGSEVVIDIVAIHRDKRHWPDPNRFNPERFMGQQNRHPFAYLPFSAGVRNCIGQKYAILEAKALLFSAFRTFRVVTLNQIDAVPAIISPTLRAAVPIRVKLELRSRRSPHLDSSWL